MTQGARRFDVDQQAGRVARAQARFDGLDFRHRLPDLLGRFDLGQV